MTAAWFAPGQAAIRLTLPLADLVALACAAASTGLGGWRAAVYATAAWAALAASGLHRLRICLRVLDQAGRICAAVAFGVACVLPRTPASQGAALALAAAGLLLACRVIAMAGLRAAHRHGWLSGAALLVGVEETAYQLAGLLQRQPDLGLRPVGWLASGPGPDGPLRPVPGPGATWLPVLGQLADLEAVATRHRISRVIVCPGGTGRGPGAGAARLPRGRSGRVRHAPVARARCSRAARRPG